MKYKIIAGVVTLLAGWLLFSTVSAQSPAEGSLDESVSLAFASHSILLGDVDQEQASTDQDALSSGQPQESPDAGEALGHLIHATKQQRNNLNDSCRQLQAAYRAEGKTCEVQVLADYCKAEEAKLNLRIGYLHKLRGDRRKFFTRVWHSVKRSGTRIWTSVGPVGRRILRNVGSEAVDVVLSGGNLGGKVVRQLLIKEARNVGETELTRLLERGMGHFLQSQAALAQAAGVADCTAEKMEQARQQVAGDLGGQEVQSQPTVPDSCEPNWWNTAYWEQNVQPELQASDKRCGDFSHYQVCLGERAQAGDCPQEAIESCLPVYEEILSTSSGQVINIVDDQLYVRDDDNHFDISFSMGGGSVSGSVLIDFTTEYGGGDYCKITQQKTFSGTFNPQTCILSGSVTITETHDENRNDICWGDPFERTENWSMVIKNGKLGPGGPYNQLVGETYSLTNYLK